MTKYGETNNYSVGDFSSKIEELIKGKLDHVVYSNKKISLKRVGDYRKNNKELLDLVKIDRGLDGKKFIGADIVMSSGDIIHDPKKLTEVILKLS